MRRPLVVAGVALAVAQVIATPPSMAPRYDLPGWGLILAEDFGHGSAPGRFTAAYPGWARYDGTTDTSRDLGRPRSLQGHYSSAATTIVRDGVLDVHVHTRGGTPQVMALTPPLGPDWATGQPYGRYSVRFRTDHVPGYKIAFLLWPAGDDWSQGEIDFPEGELGEEILGHSHDITGDPSINAWSVATERSMDGWHIATIDWRPGRLTFVLDERSWTTTDPTAIPTDPMRWVLQIETGLTRRAPPLDAEGHVLIDWVAAWRFTGED